MKAAASLLQKPNQSLHQNDPDTAASILRLLADLERKQRDANTLTLAGDFLERLCPYEPAWSALAASSSFKTSRHPLLAPEWVGQNLAGRSIHVERRLKHTGAELRVARLLPIAARQGAKVSASVEPRLILLFQRSFPKSRSYPWALTQAGEPISAPPTNALPIS